MLTNYNACEANMRFYGGEAGAKLGVVVDGENWLLKYPKSTKTLTNPKVSYTTSPLSEYIGSKIYEMIGIPVHETKLGYRDGKIVVACKDFLERGDLLVEFRNIKNTYNPEIYDNGTSGSGTLLSEIITVLKTNKVLQSLCGVEARFWDMFVVDAFIGNHDRNNTNWGIITNDDAVKGIAPVYDNGEAFFDKRDDLTFSKRLADRKALLTDAIDGSISAYINDDVHHINPMIYIGGKTNSDCSDALQRFLEKCDMNAVTTFINAIPEAESGYQIIGKAQSEFYCRFLEIRYDDFVNGWYKAQKRTQRRRSL